MPAPSSGSPSGDISPALIIGTGLVGACIGCALTRAGAEVFLSDIDRSHAVVAASRGAGVVAKPRPEIVRLVVVAAPPSAIPPLVVDALARYPRAAVTDVGSVKASIERAVLAGAPEASRYVGSHPMAGSERSGPLGATPDLFIDRTWVIATRPDAAPWAVERVRALAGACLARTVELAADEHDRAVAEVSHLPQLMSSLMAARLAGAPASDLGLAGQGVRDVTRIAASDPGLWQQIIDGNRAHVLAQLRAVQEDLDRLVARLGDGAAIADLVSRGRSGAARLPGKRGRDMSELVSVVVEIPDTPGALARLFADIEAGGTNIEDLAIEHDQVREVGFLSVEVEPDRADALRTALTGHGWSLRA
ncbi:MAG: prephenate dehydrogenase [Actinomycetia bacterium]|nr:prephenate dehydrogenase [Actinomycetes bacterium]